MSDSVRDTLIAARALIADPKDWWSGGYCGYPPRHPECAVTAIDSLRTGPFKEALERLVVALPPPFAIVGRFNDTHTHSEVLALFDRAIGAA